MAPTAWSSIAVITSPARNPAASAGPPGVNMVITEPASTGGTNPRGTDPGPVSGKYAAIAMFPVRRLPLLAYDHGRIARMALARLRAKLEYTNIVFSLLPKGFTLGELQDIYEAILGRRLDRRNFRRKLFSLGLLTRLPGTRRGQHRPASLYAFRQRRPMVVRML